MKFTFLLHSTLIFLHASNSDRDDISEVTGATNLVLTMLFQSVAVNKGHGNLNDWSYFIADCLLLTNIIYEDSCISELWGEI